MSSVRVGNLEVNEVPSTGGLLLEFEGQADSRDGQELFEYLLQTHAAAIKQQTPEIRVDLKKVGFMNSSSLSAFVGWVGELQKVDQLKRYRILLEGSTTKRWQLISLKALAKLDPDQINLSFV